MDPSPQADHDAPVASILDNPWVQLVAALLVLPAIAGLFVLAAVWMLGLAFLADCLGADDAPALLTNVAGVLAWAIGLAVMLQLAIWSAQISWGHRPTLGRRWFVAPLIFVLLGTAPFVYVYSGLRSLPANCDGLQMS